MQDIHPIGGGGGRFYGGGGDRRLRPNNHLINHLALKCPRCDSANTKFCYYNNYNLSQPRHFCKSCRRYWTKGGVLRNVPVGGGCRKSKRSKPKATPPNIEDVTVEPKSNSHSSSESSSLTATTTAAAANTSGSAAAAASEAVSANSANTASTFINFSESNFFLPNSTNPSYDHHHHQPLIDHSAEGHIFQDIGGFQNLMSSSNDQEFNMAEILTPLLGNQNTNKQWNQMETDMKMEQMGGAGCFNQAGRVDQLTGLQQSRVNNSELASLDWQTGSGEHGMYDLTGTVDQAYWSQTQWGENDQSLNFLP